MNKKDFFDYSEVLLKVHKKKDFQYHCSENEEYCALCSKFVPCLMDLLIKMYDHLEKRKR